MTKRKNKNGIFYVVISFIAVVGIGSAVVAFNGNNSGTVFEGDCVDCTVEAPEANGDVSLGAFPGPDVYSDITVHGTFTHGGNELNTTSRDATHTLTYKDLNTHSYIYVMNEEAAISDLTWTLPATSTMFSLLPEIGSRRTWTFENATTTGDVDSKLIFAAGDGMDFITSSSTASLTLDAQDYVDISCMRIHYNEVADEDVACSIERYVNID